MAFAAVLVFLVGVYRTDGFSQSLGAVIIILIVFLGSFIIMVTFTYRKSFLERNAEEKILLFSQSHYLLLLLIPISAVPAAHREEICAGLGPVETTQPLL